MNNQNTTTTMTEPFTIKPPESGAAPALILSRSRQRYRLLLSAVSWSCHEIPSRETPGPETLTIGFFDGSVVITGRGLRRIAHEIFGSNHLRLVEQGEAGENIGDAVTYIRSIKVGPRRDLQ